MGELLQGPWASRSTDGERTAEPDAPRSARPRSAAEEARQDALERTRNEIRRRLAPDASAPPPADGDRPEERWAVPGVDADEPVPLPEPPVRSKRAENVAVATLTRHDASEGEVRARLLAKGVDEGDAEAELDRLRHAGLLDDRAFAERQVDRLRDRKGLGDAAIRSALRGRLVPQAVVDAVLADRAEDAEESADRLQQVADDRARRLGSLSREVADRRLTAYLMRKGYGGSAVRAAVRTALDGAGIR